LNVHDFVDILEFVHAFPEDDLVLFDLCVQTEHAFDPLPAYLHCRNFLDLLILLEAELGVELFEQTRACLAHAVRDFEVSVEIEDVGFHFDLEVLGIDFNDVFVLDFAGVEAESIHLLLFTVELGFTHDVVVDLVARESAVDARAFAQCQLAPVVALERTGRVQHHLVVEPHDLEVLHLRLRVAVQLRIRVPSVLNVLHLDAFEQVNVVLVHVCYPAEGLPAVAVDC